MSGEPSSAARASAAVPRHHLNATTTTCPCHGYRRVGGTGVVGPLYECDRCAAVTIDPDAHEKWHAKARRRR